MPSDAADSPVKQRSPSSPIKPEPLSDFAIPSLPPHLARKVKREDTPLPTSNYFADSPEGKLTYPATPNFFKSPSPLTDLDEIIPSPKLDLGLSYHHPHCRSDPRLRCLCQQQQ